MSKLMAQIANKVLQEADLVSVTQLDTDQQPPADNGICHPETEVPKAAVRELENSVEFHIGHGNEFKEAGKEEEAKFQFACAETMQEVLILLRKGNEKHAKLATIAFFSAKNSIQDKFPKAVLDYLIPKQSGAKSLKEYFSSALTAQFMKMTENAEILAEDVFGIIDTSLNIARSHNPNDPKSQQAFVNAAKYMSLLVSFMQIDKQTNSAGEEALRSYVPVGALYRNDAPASINKFAQFLQTRAKTLDFGRFDPVRITQQYVTFLTNGEEEQWEAVAGQLTDYYKQREQQQSAGAAPEEEPAGSASDEYEMRARAERAQQ